jgi:hypothetical protein
MRDNKPEVFDQQRVEALPDVSAQLNRIESVLETAESVMKQWSPFIVCCVVAVALSSVASSIALITVAVLAYGG